MADINNLGFVGAVVRSTAGRDRKRVFLVVGTAGNTQDMRILVTDGRLHRVSSPKRKNPRHVSVVGRLSREETAQIEEFDDEAVVKLVKRYDNGGSK